MGGQIGSRVESLRKQAGLSQHELSERMNIPRSTLSKIENNERKLTVEELNQLAGIFNLSMEQILNPGLEPEIQVRESSTMSYNTGSSGIRISIPQRNLDKFKQVLLYVLSEVGSRPNVGETVLYKLLYFIDFDYYEMFEEQLIGACYIKNHHGPTPAEFKKVVEEMAKDRELEKVESKYYQYPQRKYLPLKEPDLSILTGRELNVINGVLKRLSSMNAADISEYSHHDVPWLVAHEGRPINYESVFYRTPEYSRRSDD